MELGNDGKLYILAFDHRDTFEKMLGISGRASTADESERISGAKRLIYEGFRRAVEEGVPRDAAGVLVDAQYGAGLAQQAKAEGFHLAMPVEKGGQAEFDFEYGDAFGEKIEEFDPSFSKVLVRYNPEGDRALNERQTGRLQRLSDWLHERDRRLLFELLVPAEPHQLEAVDRNEERYDRRVRPGLMMRAMAELQDAGVEPDVWKIEGIEDRESCRRIAELVRHGGRDRVSCVVLGRGASGEKVEEWLRAAAGLPGYVGFAIGRSIFGETLKALAARGGDRELEIASIAAKYRRFVDVYEAAGLAAMASR